MQALVVSALQAPELRSYFSCESSCRCARAVRYGFAALVAELGSDPLAAGCAPDESAGLPDAPAGEPREPVETAVELAPL
jgi:hypothetical protein